MMERKQFRTWLEECIERCLKRINGTNLDYSNDNETIIDICTDIDKISDKIKQMEETYNKKIKQLENSVKANSVSANVIMK